MSFRPIEEIYGPIVLPIQGHQYTLPAVSMEDGVKLHAVLAGQNPDTKFEALYTILLGQVWEEMVQNGVNPAIIDRAFFTALTDFRAGREAAEDIWENGLPKGYTELVKAAVQKAMTLPGAEPTTPQPDSTNGTSGKKKPSPGKKSSPTGR